jgi:hypothetical protein
MTTSHLSAPAPQPTSKLAEQADQARSQRELGVALVWINTAAQLDSAEQKRDTSSASQLAPARYHFRRRHLQ